jgi:DNA replication initiation complex subunit (GINS family)
MDDKPTTSKLRIIDVERKFAAQISDVWTDMKVHLEKKIRTTKNRKNQTLQSDDFSAPTNTACAQNHS